MGTITSGIGLVSGINSKDIIDQLMSIESKPIDLIKSRMDDVTKQKLAYTEISTRLTSLRLSASSFQKQSFFENSTANSSNEDALTATATKGAAVGSYQFQVARLVTSQQLVGKGFTNFDTAPVGAGTLTIETGGGEVTAENNLADLRGGLGVARGQFRLMDRSGATAIIDTSDAITLNDVVKKINTSLDINVKAEVENDHLKLTDQTGKTTAKLTVQDIGTNTAAADLGIVATATATTIAGTDVNYLGRKTALSTLNDGRGVGGIAGADLRIKLRTGANLDVDLGSATTLGEVIDAINTAAGTKLTASIPANGKGITLVDSSGGAGALTVTSLNNSGVAKDLGLDAAAAGATLTGNAVLSRANTVLISSLNGGKGINLGTIKVTSRAGVAKNINLSGAKTLQTAIETINNAAAGVKASVNSSGNGLQLTDTTGATGNLVISDVTGEAAAKFGFAGTFNNTVTTVKGANLQRQWVSGNTLLSSFNGGKGVAVGKLDVTASDGTKKTISIDPATDIHAADVLKKINAAFAGKVVARINDNGDGLMLEDKANGTLKLSVADAEGTTATDLNLKGEATNKTIDGTFEKTVVISATDSLADVQTKVNNLNYGVTASIINDGTGSSPYRLSLNTKSSGRQGRVTFDAGTTTLDTRNLVEAQDAAVFVGAAGAAQPLLITASRNQISGVIKGVNIDLVGVSDKPVTVNVARSIDNVSDELQKFTDTFNELTTKLGEYTKFDSATLTRGVLLGDSSAGTVESTIYGMLNTVVAAGGKYTVLAQIGLKVGDGGQLSFDADKFQAAYAADPDSVENLFTAAGAAINSSTSLDRLNNDTGVQTAAGKTDFTATLRDSTALNISLTDASTLGDVVSSLNAAGQAKMKAELSTDGKLVLTDLTAGATAFKLEQKNGSQALFDLQLDSAPVGGVITGRPLSTATPRAGGRTGGIGLIFQDKINKLIDPVSGVVTRTNRALDQKNDQFQDRIDTLDKLITSKRTRLEKQFANLESVLSGLQNQQSSLNSLSTNSTSK